MAMSQNEYFTKYTAIQCVVHTMHLHLWCVPSLISVVSMEYGQTQMCQPFTHKSVRQLEILNKYVGPNSTDERVLYVNVHLLP